MVANFDDIKELLRMVESDNLDIRTVTLGISLLDCMDEDIDIFCDKIRKKIYKFAKNHLKNATELEGIYGIPIVNKRLAITPVAILTEPLKKKNYFKVAQTLDDIAGELGIDYLGGYSALVHKGFTPNEREFLSSIPESIGKTKRICSSINVATTKTGINFDAIKIMGHIIKELAGVTADNGAIGCAKLVVFANAVEDNPFIAGAFHGIGEPECVINVGVSGPGVVLSAIKRLKEMGDLKNIGDISETVKRISFKLARAGELIGRKMADSLGNGVQFGILDLSLAPTPAIGDSVADIIQAMGIESVGGPGTTAAVALLTDAVKKGGLMASSYVGGLSGAFIPVSEDRGMINGVINGSLSLDKLEAMTAVCSVGMDMVAIPGKTPAETISGIIADEISIGVINAKTTAVRIIPVPGKDVGDKVVYGGLLGEAPIMAVTNYSCKDFINLGGRIPAPVHSYKN